MLYLPELYYFFDQKNFPLEKTVLVTAKKVSESCGYYQARLIWPLKGVKETERQGSLPAATEEKHKFIEELIKWIFSNLATPLEDFALFFDDEEIGQRKDNSAKFSHHDDTCCWAMNITEREFQDLKTAWKNNGLPEDLFYPEGQEIKIMKPPGAIARLLIKLGFTFENSKIYTPKRWAEKKQKEFAAKLD